MSLFKELKRRNVFKVAAAYVIIGWLIMQAGEVMGPALRLPEWVNSLLAFFLILGFPLAMFFAWAFELTPGGLKREIADVPEAEIGTLPERKSRKQKSWITIAALFSIAAITWWSFQLTLQKPGHLEMGEDAETEQGVDAFGVLLPRGPKIAVLPFKNLSNDSEQKYFSDGLTEDIITALSRTDLFVLGFSPELHNFRDLGVMDIGKELDVRYLLKGSVRRDANTIRVSGQLFDAHSGAQIWGESYSRDLTVSNIFAIQDDITARVVGTIADAGGIIARVGLGEIGGNPTKELAAYECVLRSYAYEGIHTAEAHLKARDCIEQAIELDSSYAEALSTAAYLYREEHFHDFNQRPGALQNAMNSARRAIDLDPLNQDAYYALAFIYFDLGVSEIDEFFDSAKHAIELNPNNTRVIGGMGALIAFAGEWEWGIELLEKTISINPYSHMNGWLHFVRATDYFQRGLHSEALVEINQSHFSFPVALINIIAIHAKLGDQEYAAAALKEALFDNSLFMTDSKAQLEHFYPGDEDLHTQFMEGLDMAALWMEE